MRKREGGGGEGDRETGTTRIDKGQRASTKKRYLSDACQRVEELNTIAGGAVSFVPPSTPKPSTTSRTSQGGGGKPSYGTLDRKPGEDIGRPSAGGL